MTVPECVYNANDRYQTGTVTGGANAGTGKRYPNNY